MPRNECRVFVGNLPPDVTTKEIEGLFSKYGNILYVDLKNRRGPPYAFVEFEDPRDVEDAIYGRNGYGYCGDRLRVEYPRGGRRRRSSRRDGDGRGPRAQMQRSQFRVMVSGLPPGGSWQDLKDHMLRAGQICFADVGKDGTGLVEYLRYEDMKYAVKKLDDSKFRSHEGEISYIRVKEDYRIRCRSRSRSRSRSYERR